MQPVRPFAIFMLLIFCTFQLFANEPPFPGAPAGAAAFGPVIGDHKCVMTYRGEDGELSETADCRWLWYYKFDGHMVQDEFYMYDGEGKVVWNGSTLRTWDPSTQQWNNMFLGVHGTGFGKMFHGKPVGDEIHLEVGGTEPDGRDYLDRIYFYAMADGKFRWRQERSYDQGEVWQLWVTVDSL